MLIDAYRILGMKVCQSALRGYKNVRLRFLEVVRLESKSWNAESCSELLQVIQPQGCFRGKCDSSTVIDGQHRMRASSPLGKPEKNCVTAGIGS